MVEFEFLGWVAITAGAALLANIQVYRFMRKRHPEEIQKAEGEVKKQAVIIDNAVEARMPIFSLAGMIATSLAFSLGNILAGFGMSEREIMQKPWFGAPFVLSSILAICAVLVDVLSPVMNYLQAAKKHLGDTKELAKILRKRGFVVSIFHDYDDHLKAVELLKERAGDDTLTLFYYGRHGGMEKQKGKAHSVLEDGTSDSKLLAAMNEVKGTKLLAIQTCCAGGFVDRAQEMGPDREKYIILTASNRRLEQEWNGASVFRTRFIRAVRKDEDIGKVFSSHAARVESRNNSKSVIEKMASRVDTALYQPRAFVGRQAAGIRL